MTHFPKRPFDLLPGVIKRTLGRPATYTPAAGGGPYSLQAVITMPSEGSPIDGTSGSVEMTVPTALIELSDLPVEPRSGDTLTCDGVTFTVRRPRPTGNGAVKLELNQT